MSVLKFSNHDGKNIDYSSSRTYNDLHFSDLALLVFYYNLIKKGTIGVGGAGFHRFTMLKSRVFRREQEMIERPINLKNTKRRKYIQKLLRAGTEFEYYNTTT